MKKTEKIIVAAVTMAIGVLLIVLQNNFISLLMTILGVCLIAYGVLDIFHHEIPPAVIKLVAGLLIIVCGWALVQAVLYIVAAILLIVGALMLYDKIKKKVRWDNWILTALEYAAPVVCILIGGLLLFQQSEFTQIILIVSGILTLIEGGILLVNTLMEDM